MPVRGHDDSLDRFGLPAPGPTDTPDAFPAGRFRRDNGLVDRAETVTRRRVLQRVLDGLHQLDTENPDTENPDTENPGIENPGIENPGTASSTVGSTENGPVRA